MNKTKIRYTLYASLILAPYIIFAAIVSLPWTRIDLSPDTLVISLSASVIETDSDFTQDIHIVFNSVHNLYLAYAGIYENGSTGTASAFNSVGNLLNNKTD